MGALVDLVLDSYVEDFVAELRRWDAARRPGDVDGAVVDYVALLRRHLPSGRAGAVPVLDDAALSVRFVDAAVEALVDTLEATTIPAYAARHPIEITHVRTTFVVLTHGLVALLRTQPDVGDDVLVTIVRQTLRLAPATPAA